MQPLPVCGELKMSHSSLRVYADRLQQVSRRLLSYTHSGFDNRLKCIVSLSRANVGPEKLPQISHNPAPQKNSGRAGGVVVKMWSAAYANNRLFDRPERHNSDRHKSAKSSCCQVNRLMKCDGVDLSSKALENTYKWERGGAAHPMSPAIGNLVGSGAIRIIGGSRSTGRNQN